jgi:hypothetical protein
VAQVAKTITVAYPGVSVRCPKSAKPKGCHFKLQAIARKPKKGKKAPFESALAKGSAKAGHSTTITLIPMPAFNETLASAGSILVKETVLAKGKGRTSFVKLRVVQ